MEMATSWLEVGEKEKILSEVYTCIQKEQEEVDQDTFSYHHTKRLCKSLIDMRVDYPELCDVRIKTEGNDIFAHSVILATFCDYFKTLFTTKLNYPSRNSEGVFMVNLSHFSQLSVDFFIQLLYNNQDLDKKRYEDLDIGEFMVLLDFIGYDEIQDMFINSIKSLELVTEATWYRWYSFAEHCGFERLRVIILSYASFDFEKFIKSAEFKLLPYETLKALMTCDLITCYPENVLREAERIWLRAGHKEMDEFIKMPQEDMLHMSNDINTQTTNPDHETPGSTTTHIVQDCLLFPAKEYPFDYGECYGFLFEANSVPKFSKLKYHYPFLFFQEHSSFSHFIFRHQLHIAHNDGNEVRHNGPVLIVESYNQCHKDNVPIIIFEPMESRNYFDIKFASCFGEFLFVLLEFPDIDPYIYFFHLDSIPLKDSKKDTKCCQAIQGIEGIFWDTPSEIVCYSFTELQRISYSNPACQLSTFSKNITSNNPNLEDCKKHFICVKRNLYCFVEDSLKQRVIVLFLNEEEKECTWVVMADTACLLSLNLVFVFKDRVFAFFDELMKAEEKEKKKKSDVNKLKERSFWEFKIDEKDWAQMPLAPHIQLCDLTPTPIQIPRHVLY